MKPEDLRSFYPGKTLFNSLQNGLSPIYTNNAVMSKKSVAIIILEINHKTNSLLYFLHLFREYLTKCKYLPEYNSVRPPVKQTFWDIYLNKCFRWQMLYIYFCWFYFISSNNNKNDIIHFHHSIDALLIKVWLNTNIMNLKNKTKQN